MTENPDAKPALPNILPADQDNQKKIFDEIISQEITDFQTILSIVHSLTFSSEKTKEHIIRQLEILFEKGALKPDCLRKMHLNTIKIKDVLEG